MDLVARVGLEDDRHACRPAPARVPPARGRAAAGGPGAAAFLVGLPRRLVVAGVEQRLPAVGEDAHEDARVVVAARPGGRRGAGRRAAQDRLAAAAPLRLTRALWPTRKPPSGATRWAVKPRRRQSSACRSSACRAVLTWNSGVIPLRLSALVAASALAGEVLAAGAAGSERRRAGSKPQLLRRVEEAGVDGQPVAVHHQGVGRGLARRRRRPR